MRRSLLLATLVVAMFVFKVPTASAQATEGFQVGYTDIGPTIGLGGIGGASFAFGARFENGFRALPNLGDGILGLQVSFDYYTYGEDFFGDAYDFSYMPISVIANYHFSLDNRKIDPFVGVGLGYQRVSSDFDACDQFGIDCDFSTSGVYFVGRLGLRYFMAPRAAVYFDVGAGAATLNVGLMFRIK
jgi:opacity protein-like surface antigen